MTTELKSDGMTGKQRCARLGELLGKAGKIHYQRARLAAANLADADWIADPSGGGGDINRAIDRLEQDYFGDVIGVLGLTQIVEIFHNVSFDEWERNKFRLAKVWADYQQTKRPKPRKPTVQPAPPHPAMAPLPFAEFTVMPKREQEREFAKMARVIETDAQKVSRLEAEKMALLARIGELEVENKSLKAQLAQKGAAAVA